MFQSPETENTGRIYYWLLLVSTWERLMLKIHGRIFFWDWRCGHTPLNLSCYTTLLIGAVSEQKLTQHSTIRCCPVAVAVAGRWQDGGSGRCYSRGRCLDRWPLSTPLVVRLRGPFFFICITCFSSFARSFALVLFIDS